MSLNNLSLDHHIKHYQHLTTAIESVDVLINDFNNNLLQSFLIHFKELRTKVAIEIAQLSKNEILDVNATISEHGSVITSFY